MTKRLYTAVKVLEAVLDDVDDDQDYDDPDEPVMEGSDNEFSDLELDEDDFDIDIPPPNSPFPSSSPSAASPSLSMPPPLQSHVMDHHTHLHLASHSILHLSLQHRQVH